MGLQHGTGLLSSEQWRQYKPAMKAYLTDLGNDTSGSSGYTFKNSGSIRTPGNHHLHLHPAAAPGLSGTDFLRSFSWILPRDAVHGPRVPASVPVHRPP
jgi:hypothetical protein